MCQLWQFPKNVVHSTSQSRRRATDCRSQMSKHQGVSRRRFQNGFNLSRKASRVNPTHIMSWRKHLMRWKKSQPNFLFSQKCPRDQTRASQLERTMFFHMFLKIRIVKLVSLQKLPELRFTFRKILRGERISFAASFRSCGAGPDWIQSYPTKKCTRDQ